MLCFAHCVASVLPVANFSRRFLPDGVSVARFHGQLPVTRRQIVGGFSVMLASTFWTILDQPPSADSATKKQLDPKFVAAFNKALQDSSDSTKAESSWSEVISLDESNSYAWSNRGTVRLQQGQWKDAKEDLEKARELEALDGEVSGILLNNLGNAKGALGDWSGAMKDFQDAALDEEVTPIALANLALARFQVGETEEGIRQARSLVRRDPNFLDMRCALTAFLWASGSEADAETEWRALQLQNDGLGGLIYKREVAIKRVQGRWPPRAVAALDAFLNLSRTGQSLDYDRTKKTFSFP